MEDDYIPGADPRRPEVRIGWEIASAEYAARTSNRAIAELWRSIDATLAEAREHPEVFMPMVEHVAVPTDFADYAHRAAVADLAIRLSLAEGTIRVYAANAATLAERTPRIWAEFLDGEVSVANARTTADLAMTLPGDSDFTAFENELAPVAGSLAPARFRTKARAVRERVHAIPLLERHQRAAEQRRVALEHDVDGMSWLHLNLPSEQAVRAYVRIDMNARHLAKSDTETRTLDQLRGDTAADLLNTGGSEGGPGPVGVTVGVTVPVLTLLGGDAPGELEGYGPIDADTARHLAADLKRMVQVTKPTCGHPGCGRRAVDCDIDHVTAYIGQHGKTAYNNLIPLCRLHHRIKSITRWDLRRSPTGDFVFTTPTGFQRSTDPPPF